MPSAYALNINQKLIRVKSTDEGVVGQDENKYTTETQRTRSSHKEYEGSCAVLSSDSVVNYLARYSISPATDEGGGHRDERIYCVPVKLVAALAATLAFKLLMLRVSGLKVKPVLAGLIV